MSEETSEADQNGVAKKVSAKTDRKAIPGNLAYLSNTSALKSVLDKIVSASKPEKFTQDYLANVLGMSGGSARATIPILKRIGFLTSDGTPTELYSKFRVDTGRAEAVFSALRNGWAELFRRSEHVYAADDKKLTDLILEVTGLERSDPALRAVRGTFRVFTSYLPTGFASADLANAAPIAPDQPTNTPEPHSYTGEFRASSPLGLSYHINIVIPETKDAEVLNAIFRSLRDNLLRS